MADEENVVGSPIFRDLTDIPELPLAEYLLPKLRTNLPLLGDKPWVVDLSSGTKVLFREVEDLSFRLGSGLARLGFKHRDVLFYVTWEMAQLFVVQLAVWRLGGAVRPWHQSDTVETYTRLLHETNAKFVLVDQDTVSVIRKAISSLEWPVTVLSIGDVDGATSIDELLHDDGLAFPKHVPINPREDVVIIPNTSGSTGQPKGVLHTHYSVIAALEAYGATGTMKPTDQVGDSILTMMVNFAAGYLISNVMSLRNGISAYFISKFEKEEFVDLLLTYMPNSTAMYQHLAAWFVRHPDLEDVDFSFLKKIETGAAIFDPVTIAKFKKRIPHVQLVLSYAMTESFGIASSKLHKDLEDEQSEAPLIKIVENNGVRFASSGHLLPFMKAKVVDPYTKQTLQRGDIGELRIKSPTLTLGYHQPGSNAPNRSSFDDDDWFCTGDLGFIDKEGRVVIMERLNFTYKCQAHIVSPSEIESVLVEHDAVLSVGVVGIPQPEVDCLSRAFVVLRPGHHVSADELQTHVAARLPEHKHLHGGVRFISALPINTAGKVDRRKLKELALENSTKDHLIELLLDVE